MRYRRSIGLYTLLFAATALGQPPKVANSSTGPGAAAIAGSKEDPKAVDRGAKLFAANCGGCHGANAKGGPGAPHLVRSVLVLDGEKGVLIAPVLREGRLEQWMPTPNVAYPQISDI